MKVVIIEDEALAAKNLQQQLRQIDPQVQVLAILRSVAQGVKWFQEHTEPDLVLSDIQLSDGISFEIFEQHPLQCPLIFTTAYDEYAIRAFKVNSIDYLLKPIDKDELKHALEKYGRLQQNIPPGQLADLLKQLSKPVEEQPIYKERFLVIRKNGLLPVQAKDIAGFTKDELIYIYTFDGLRYLSEQHTLEEVEHLLDPDMFFRANRQYIVHIDVVGQLKSTHKGLTVYLRPPFNTYIDISREKAREFKDWLSR